MTENSSLFSLEQLTQQAAQKTAATRDEESGLIDLQQIEASGATLTPRVPPVPVVAAPPPLRLPVEESTLNGLVAVAVAPRHSRLKWAALFGAVCLLSAGLGTFLASLDSKPAPAAASAPLIIYVPATSGTALQAVSPAVPGSASSLAVRGVNTAAPLTETPPAVGVKVPGNVAGTSSRTQRPSRQPPTQNVDKPSPSRSKPTTQRPKDPCAHCAGDLSCAMRCSVTRP